MGIRPRQRALHDGYGGKAGFLNQEPNAVSNEVTGRRLAIARS